MTLTHIEQDLADNNNSILSRAMQEIVSNPMMTAREVASLYGFNEQRFIQSLNDGSHRGLLALPTDRGWLFPAFQFDMSRKRAYRGVASVNSIFDSVLDPWGCASWWLSKHTLIGMRPADLLGCKRIPQGKRKEDCLSMLIAIAEAVFEPVG